MPSPLREQAGIPSVEMAAYHAVHGHPLGCGGVAAQMNLVPTRLNHKLSPTNAANYLSVSEWLTIFHLTGDGRMPEAMAHALGVLFVALPAVPEGQGALMTTVTSMVSEIGDVTRELDAALRGDGRVDAEEFLRIEREATQAQAAIAGLVELLRKQLSPADRKRLERRAEG